MNILFFKEEQKEDWDYFVSHNADDGGLLQSWAWGDFQKDLGKKIWRIGVEDDKNNLLATCLLIKDNLALRQVTLDIPRGPIVKGGKISFEILKVLIEEIKKIGKEENVMVLRFDFSFLEYEDTKTNKKIFSKLKLKRADRDIQPKTTLRLNLKKEKEDILKSMKQKHRYNIRLAERKGVEVFLTNNSLDDFEKFWELLKETHKRDNFAIHSKDYYWKLLNTSNLKIKLYLAKYKEEIVAGAILGSFGKVSVYMHGASSNKFRFVMAPYLLQWKMISDSIEKGYFYYDFGGVKSFRKKTSSQTSWDGITRFKKGFAPKENYLEFFGLWELRLKKGKSFLYRIIRRLSKLRKLFKKKRR